MSFPDRTTQSTAVFAIQAAADPSALPRVIDLFAKHGLVPSRWVGNAHESDANLHLTLEFDGLAAGEARALANGLRRILCVETVVTDSRALSARRA
ncbi:MAG: hypothetical protein O3C65_03130 [Proteobacteria bacterium]|nr:hypothetical protein [Pseudomonadota bacterium]MDA1057655.1 hypothetical protein [Pseudomonadota bacterium]